MLGMLERGQADVTACTMEHSPERGADFDFTAVVNRAELGLNMARPDTKLTNLWVYAHVFQDELWLAVAAASLVLGAVTAAVQRCSLVQGVGAVLVSLILRDAGAPDGGRVGAKMVYLTTTLTGFLIFTSYAALLTASMVTAARLPSIKSFPDIIDQNYKIFLWEGSSSEVSFRTATPGSPRHTIYTKLIRGREHEALFRSGDQALAIMRSDSKALVFDWVTAFLDQDDIVSLDGFEDSDSVLASFALPKNSELLELFNHHILKLQQGGVTDKLNFHWFQSRIERQKETQKGGEAEALGYDNLAFPFLLCCGAVVVSVAVGIIEHILSVTARCRHFVVGL